MRSRSARQGEGVGMWVLGAFVLLASSLLVLGSASLAACGSPTPTDRFSASAGDAGDGVPSFDNGGPIVCSAGQKTRISGVAYDPAGKVPLYNVMVYVPRGPLPPVTDGVSCDRCGGTALDPLASALTNVRGEFALDDVPVTTNEVEIVVQIGKWRRAKKVPIRACESNVLTDPEFSRLPRNAAEGSLPRLAISTGGCDPFECLLRRMGVDDSEFTDALGTGHIHLYKGITGSSMPGGSSFSSGLWNSLDTMKKYDAVLLACECDPYKKTAMQLDALHQYAGLGGRVFASHYSYVWLESGPTDFRAMANWTPDRQVPINGTYTVDTSFPKGSAFAEWLVAVKASPSLGTIGLDQVKGDVGQTNPPAQRWIFDQAINSVKYLTFNTPTAQAPEAQCGRVLFTDIHVATEDDTSKLFPAGCGVRALSPQEKALEFMLLDLTSCIQDDRQPPQPPK